MHQRYRLEYGRKNDTVRLRYVERNPQAAIGGARHADAELHVLRHRLDACDDRYARLLPELECMLSDLAADWPSDGLSDEQMLWLDNIFVGTAEIRYRLAEKLPQGSNRNQLLKENIAQLCECVGLTKPPKQIPLDYFLPNESVFQPLAEWTARSLCLLYEADKRGVGKRTSDLVSRVVEAAESLVAQPFVAARKPEAWQSITTRAACACRFALIVVASVPEIKRSTVTMLNALALEHAFKLLSYGQFPVLASKTFFRLMTQAVHGMRYHSSPDDLREQWGLAAALPDFARALALWSSPVLATKHWMLATDLFGSVAALPLSQEGQDLRMSEMISLFDVAVSSCAAADRTDVVAQVVSLWRGAYKDWRAITAEWAGSADMLAGAFAENGPERAQLLADPIFSQTYCAQLLAPSDDVARSP